MSEFEDAKRVALQPIYFEAGAGLYDCQAFENAMAYMLYLMSRLGMVELNPIDMCAIMDHETKKTAGQLAAMLRRHAEISEGIEGTLAAALSARNTLIHRYLVDNVERFVEPRNYPQMVREIANLRAAVQRGHRAIDPFIKVFMALADGADCDQFIEDLKQQMAQRWSADG